MGTNLRSNQVARYFFLAGGSVVMACLIVAAICMAILVGFAFAYIAMMIILGALAFAVGDWVLTFWRRV